MIEERTSGAKLVQSMEASGSDAETLWGGNGKGHRCPLLKPLAAVINRTANNGGAGLRMILLVARHQWIILIDGFISAAAAALAVNNSAPITLVSFPRKSSSRIRHS